MNMSKRETLLAITVAVILGGLALLYGVINPTLAAFDDVDQQAEDLVKQLDRANALVEIESKIRRDWIGYERAGLSRSLEEADAQTGGALLAWAEKVGLQQITLSDGKDKTDDEQPFGELTYILQATGEYRQIYALLWEIRESPFALCLEKCVIDLRNDRDEDMQFAVTVSTLFTPEAESK